MSLLVARTAKVGQIPPVRTVQEFLEEAPFTLTLSAGFFGFFAHAGALAALEEAGLRPARVTGSSAGALIAGLWAGGADPRAIEEELSGLRREHFWDPSPGFGLLRGRRFRRRVEGLMTARTFEAARVPAALSVWDVLTRRTVVRDRGELAGAICASCAFPGLLQPVWIEGRPYLDGGIADRPAQSALRPGERVLFHHLPGKSPWRRAAPAIPWREPMVAIAPLGLPRLGPFRLGEGREAFRLARDHFLRALAGPLVPIVTEAV